MPLIFRRVVIKLIDCMYVCIFVFSILIEETKLVANEWHYCYIFHQSCYRCFKKYLFYIRKKCPTMMKVTHVIERAIIAQHHYKYKCLYTMCIISLSHMKLICNRELFLSLGINWTIVFSGPFILRLEGMT